MSKSPVELPAEEKDVELPMAGRGVGQPVQGIWYKKSRVRIGCEIGHERCS